MSSAIDLYAILEDSGLNCKALLISDSVISRAPCCNKAKEAATENGDITMLPSCKLPNDCKEDKMD